MADRRFDLVLFGATGFTGGLTAEYLAANAPSSLRWALAGRNMDKLEQVRQRLGPDAGKLELLKADIGDADSIRAVAEAATVVITTVGPYINYGEPLVAACAHAGTGYVDLTGEPEFVDRMWLKYHEQAERSGARIVHSCGFDSIPYDLGTLFTVEKLPEGVPIHIDCFMRAGGSPSAGTFHSLVHAMGRVRQSMQAAKERREQEPRMTGRRVKGTTRPPHRDDRVGAWVVPFPTIDPQTVLRSARSLDRYGPDFSYGHYLAVRRLPVLAGMGLGVGGLMAMAQLPPTRNALLKLMSSGDGPDESKREKGWFQVRLEAEADGQRLSTEVSGGDPGYSETAKMLGEAGLCLALDDVPTTAGMVTPAVAMGDALIERLQRAGIRFAVRDGAS
jgi:short subunit dehydrogenase-like uncharacterized protein